MSFRGGHDFFFIWITIETSCDIFSECEGDLVDVVFILDDSGSVGQVNFDKVKEFVADVIQRVDMDSGAVRMGVLVFDSEAEVVFYVRYLKRNFLYFQ